MESFLEAPLKDWRIGSAFDEHHPNAKLRHHAVPGGAFEQWRPIHLLGEGTFGEVYKEKCEHGFFPGKLRAVKRISKEQAGFLKSSQRELQALATFSKKNDPRQYIDDNAPFPETEGSLIAKQVAIGLRYMHQTGFLHRDLKPLNILIDTPGPGWKVKLADFGIARNIAGPTLYTHYIGTYGYIAPELFESSDAYTAAVDIWALGAIVFCMCTGSPPFEQPQYLLQYRAGIRCFPSQVLGLSTGFCIDFIMGTMHANSRQRMDMDEIMDHEWLSMERTVMNMKQPVSYSPPPKDS
ncbi:hypothetical protein NEUTE1DRAFT_41361 [Neurospora tetrasperma FGSC 2508]|uniref:non-specific serine/threonine protein kinase n=1 Tax=Neurospora tetrasperma (strain FGSC 2508 / ATCC MYA-4615 / P0657) TaxID=510951 RepID=F8MKU7_NEUT8|nr:uncharacterized protein NEUTE1DRAFT_41361 [Neurospora tetrasperma FGSC 2508]EGO57475.1 hypothetical protein NEUTE1DRAFT_41361 [Neurospora tetrasperma FGSC 2508]EGZ72267.1 kinase-like protein [Neurospora tetrasperma FGSC 2509]